MWYEWEDLESFNEWHSSICQALGIPDEHTTAYTTPIESGGKIIAVVHQAESAGLVPTELRPPEKVFD